MRPKVAVVIPAWNEQATIEEAIQSVFKQDYLLERVVVSADNCTDNTVAVTAALCLRYDHLSIMETVNNRARKAGALNQAIQRLPEDIKYVLVLDADTRAATDVVSQAVKFLEEDPALGAICARTHLTPLAKSAHLSEKIWWHLQRLEYATADSRRVERLDNIQILAGSCVMYRMDALKQVARYRGNGQFYDEGNLIEDYELTLTLKELGWKVTIGIKMHSWTDVPLSLRVHWQQRIRWARSHVDTLRKKGLNKVTRRDIVGHVIFCLLLPQQLFFLGLLIYLLLAGVDFDWNPLLWVFLGLLWGDRLYRIKYVFNPTATDVLIRVAFLPEEIYGLYQSVQRVWAYWLAFTNGPEEWHLT
jgi:cellulose synthase/poly-beta-1,6-N-acetylglucosamine synthase-like glycosyltransferase